MISESLKRLSTFVRWPMPSDACSGITNFASKAAEAHWERSTECVNDEVVCTSCGVTYGGWKNESPAAVHRVVSPKCPALNPVDDGDSQSEQHQTMDTALASRLRGNPYVKYLPDRVQQQLQVQTGESDSLEAGGRTPEQPPNPDRSGAANTVRRALFPESGSGTQHPPQQGSSPVSRSGSPQCGSASRPPTSVLEQAPFTQPFRTQFGGYDNLFASKRLQTFPAPVSCAKYQAWAEEGFAFRVRQQDVMCVFCGTVLVLNGHQPKMVHEKTCPSCPFIMGFDVGNISQRQEKDIRLKYFTQQAAKKQCEFDHIRINKYPHYEKEKDRQGSFQNWPKMCARMLPSADMAMAGFFYSGCSDKVVCYSCGVELYNWSEDADVWKTHARMSPTCLHVISHKGQDFIAQSAATEVLVEMQPARNSAGGGVDSSGGVEPGSPNLDMTAVKAALACRFPNKAILMASLKGADENHATICRQQQVVRQKDTVIQEKDTVIQEKDTVIQEKDTVIQEKDTQLQRVIQEKDTQLQRVIQEKEQTVQTVQQQLAQKDEQLNNQATQLSEAVTQLNDQATQLSEAVTQLSWQERQLQMQDDQIQSLMSQVQQLRVDHHHRDPAPGPDGDGMQNRRAEEGGMLHSLVCKICLSDKPRMIFLPCGHLFCCAECASRLPDERCPVCRQNIADTLPAFVA